MTPVWHCPEENCEAFLGRLNLVEPTIQFTLEQDSDGKLPLLDILLEHHPDGWVYFHLSVLKKITHMDIYLDFYSHHPFSHQLAVVSILPHRTNSILSLTWEALKEEKAHLTNALFDNGYPRSVFRWFSNLSGKATQRIKESPKATVSLVFVVALSLWRGSWNQLESE